MVERKPTIIVDTREKTPWDWEGDDAFEDIVYEKLDVGDYSIRGLEDVIAIERKAGPDELFNNFGKKASKDRIIAEFERMVDHKHKIMMIEASCETMMNPQAYYVVKKKRTRLKDYQVPAVVMSNLTEIILKYDIHVIFGGDKAQSMAKAILLRAWQMHKHGISE
jgi:ERCC4-type nuclease